jgi:lysophospholipase L1-like esterase
VIGDARRTPVDRAARATWRAVALALGGCLAASLLLLASEYAYRFYRLGSLRLRPVQLVEDSLLVYRLNPASEDVRNGFRGAGPPSDRRGGVLVVCLGGSTTYGHRLPARRAWPHVTQGLLLALGVRAWVLNAGVPGYGSRQLLLRYRSEIAPLAADVVVIYEGWNRTGALRDPDGMDPFGIAGPGQGAFGRLVAALGPHSLLLQHAATPFALRRRARRARWHPDRFQATWEADMDSLVGEAAARGQRPVVVLYPSLYHQGMTAGDLEAYRGRGWQGRPFAPEMLQEIAEKHAALRRIAALRGALVADVAAALDTVRGPARAELFMDEWHLSVAGNRRVAELVAAELVNAVPDPLKTPD